jgi:hypothetical protein
LALFAPAMSISEAPIKGTATAIRGRVESIIVLYIPRGIA